MNKSIEYWMKRQNARLTHSERISNKTIADIASIYDDSLKRVDAQIENILNNYAKDVKLPKDELKELLSQHDVKDLLNKLNKDLRFTNSNTPENMKWIKGNYLKRIDREQAIKLQLENERRIIAHHEDRLSTRGYTKTIDDTYKSITKDLIGQSAVISDAAKESMLSKRWVADRNYSERVWKNTDTLFTEINESINSAILSGQSTIQVRNEIAEKYQVAKYRAEALVRTEMNYFENQTELQSYLDFGVTHYIYFAVRDQRTSSISASLDGQRFALKDAQIGLNYPPMHTNCRAGTLPDLDYEDETRVYRDPVTGKRISTDLPYEEWYQQQRQDYKNGPEAYDIEIKKLKNRNQDKKQYMKYSQLIGQENMPKSLALFQKLKYNDVNNWDSLKDYVQARRTNELSVWTSFNDYKSVKEEIASELIGLTTSDGVQIKSSSKHFINRVFGTNNDPKAGRPRDGVEIELIKDALLNGNAILNSRNVTSIKYRNQECEVSVNLHTGNLIQTNPTKKGRR